MNLFRTLLISSVAIGGALSPQINWVDYADAKTWIDKTETAKRTATAVTIDDTVIMRSDLAFREVRVANSKIADVVVLTNQTFQLVGKTNGRTNVVLYDANNQLVDIIDVNVGYDLKSLRRNIYESYPAEDVQVREMAGGLFLSGDVRNAEVADGIMKIAQAYGNDKVTNGLSIRDSHQVMLEVRFVEATRNVAKDLGIGLLVQQAGQFAISTTPSFINGAAQSGGLSGLGNISAGLTNIDIRLDTLEENGSIRTLAEPNLVAMSGETASFLAGGEFPIPIPQDGGTNTIEFKQFGVGLAFTPTVLDDGIINLKVSPEVSQLDFANSSGGIPALTVRRADTTVELRNSQSFAIAGLLQNNTSGSKSQVPWLGDVPVLGPLFRSSSYSKNETELMIIITPRLVQPASDIRKLATPLDNTSNTNDAEFFFNGQLEKPSGNSRSYRVPGTTIEQSPSSASRTYSAPKTTAKITPKGGLSGQYGYALQ